MYLLWQLLIRILFECTYCNWQFTKRYCNIDFWSLTLCLFLFSVENCLLKNCTIKWLCFFVCFTNVLFVFRANVQTVRNLFSVENGHRLADDQWVPEKCADTYTNSFTKLWLMYWYLCFPLTLLFLSERKGTADFCSLHALSLIWPAKICCENPKDLILGSLACLKVGRDMENKTTRASCVSEARQLLFSTSVALWYVMYFCFYGWGDIFL